MPGSSVLAVPAAGSAWLVIAFTAALLSDASGAPAASSGSAACTPGGSAGSGSGAECPTPDPTSHMQTIFTWDCDGRVRIMPDNPLVNVNLDIPMLPRMMQAFYTSLKGYVKGQCSQTKVSDEAFRDRYHPLAGALYGNRIYSSTDIDSMDCLDGAGSFTRDFPKLYKALAGASSFEMPSSCKYDSWSQTKDPLSPSASKRDPKCSFVHELMEIGAQLQVVVKKCSNHKDFFKISVGCEGNGCNLFKPCQTDYDCNSKDHLVCADPFNWKDPKIKDAKPKFQEEDVYNLMRDFMYLYSNKPYGDKECKKYFPAEFLKKFIGKFAKYIVGSPEATGGMTCDPADPDSVCKVCLPAHTTAFETTLSDFPGRWREVSDEYPKSRYKKDSDGCVLSPDRLKSNTSTLLGDGTLPTILAPVHPKDATKALRYPAHAHFFATESPLVQGAKVYVKGSQVTIGGRTCTDHNNCGTGLCVDNNEAYCELAQNECDRHSQCELDSANLCVPIHPAVATPAPKSCACFALDRFTLADSPKFTYGDACDQAQYIGDIEASDLLDSFYSESIHKWRSRYDPFIYWDGVTGPDGIDPFVERDHWVKFPDMEAPAGEMHLASTQCNGVIHLFMNAPYHVRAYAPKLNDLLQFATQFNYDTWKCRDYKSQLTDKVFLVSQALHRPDPWLFGKVLDKDQNYQAVEPADYTTLLRWLFNESSLNTTETFSMWNFHHVMKLSPSMTLSDWFQAGYVGTKYTGLRGKRDGDGLQNPLIMDSAFSLNFRAQTCKDYPMGVAEMHLTCKGRSCGEMLMSTPCQSTGCLDRSQCSNVFKQQYDDDVMGQMLWGVSRPVTGQYYTEDSLCPALEDYGKLGMTKKEPGKAVKDMSRLLWTDFRHPDCPKRTEETCWGHCRWVRDENDDIYKCLYLPGADPPVIAEGSEMMFCVPGNKAPVQPFMSQSYYDAIVGAYGFTTHIGKRGDGGTGTSTADSANIFDLWQQHIRDKSMQSYIFSVANDAADIAPATLLDTESLYSTPVSDSTGPFGKSFIIVVLVMCGIVFIATVLVWWNYIRKTPEEKARLARLRGLSFAFKQDNSVYGRDLMVPEMYTRWLPGGENHSLKPPKTLDDVSDDEVEDDVLLSPRDSKSPLDAPSAGTPTEASPAMPAAAVAASSVSSPPPAVVPIVIPVSTKEANYAHPDDNAFSTRRERNAVSSPSQGPAGSPGLTRSLRSERAEKRRSTGSAATTNDVAGGATSVVEATYPYRPSQAGSVAGDPLTSTSHQKATLPTSPVVPGVGSRHSTQTLSDSTVGDPANNGSYGRNDWASVVAGNTSTRGKRGGSRGYAPSTSTRSLPVEMQVPAGPPPAGTRPDTMRSDKHSANKQFRSHPLESAASILEY